MRASTGQSVRVPSPPDLGELRVPVEAKDGICEVRFTVTPTRVPAEELPGFTDTRRLGTHFVGFLYEAGR